MGGYSLNSILNPYDAAFSSNGERLFVLSNSTGKIYQLNLSTGFDVSTMSSTSNSFDYTSQTLNTYSFAMEPAGTKLFILNYTLPGTIYEYSLSSSWDASTVTYLNNSYTVSDTGSSFGSSTPYMGNCNGITFSPSGHKMYVTSDTMRIITQFST